MIRIQKQPPHRKLVHREIEIIPEGEWIPLGRAVQRVLDSLERERAEREVRG